MEFYSLNFETLLDDMRVSRTPKPVAEMTDRKDMSMQILMLVRRHGESCAR